MGSLDFQVEWVEPGRVRTPELRATWASLKISVDHRPTTKVFDRDLTSVREHIFVPTYPLAEWIAFNWWSLLYECPSDARAGDYAHRHALRFAREGFVLPDLEISPRDDVALVSWRSAEQRCSKLEFLGHGTAWRRDEPGVKRNPRRQIGRAHV